MKLKILKFYLKELIFKMNDLMSSKIVFNRNLEKQLRRNGYFVIKDFINEEQCDNYRRLIDRHLDNTQAWRDEYGSDVRIFGIENLEDSFKEIFNRNHLGNIYKKYVSKNSLYQTLMAAKMSFSPYNLGSGGGWHRDTVNQRQLKFILYLSDVDHNNGGFQYVDQSHLINMKIRAGRVLGGAYLKQRYTTEDVSTVVDVLGLRVVDFKEPMGTLIVADTSGLHRGMPMENGIRYAVTSYMSEVPFGPSISDLIVLPKGS